MSASEPGSSDVTSRTCPASMCRSASRVFTIGIGQKSPRQSIILSATTGISARSRLAQPSVPLRGTASTQNFGYRTKDRNSEVTVTNAAGEGSVTRASLREYAAVQRLRYQQATRAEKHQLLDEIVTVTGLHRKAAIRLLRRAPRARPSPGPGGRPQMYGGEGARAAEVAWQ